LSFKRNLILKVSSGDKLSYCSTTDTKVASTDGERQNDVIQLKLDQTPRQTRIYICSPTNDLSR